MSEFVYPTAFSSWDRAESDALTRVMASGRLTMGEEVEAFEEEFARFHARKHGVMVNSGSSANLVAVASLFEKTNKPLERPSIRHPLPLDAVVPAIAWSTTYAPLVQHGMDLVVLDVDDTWNCPVPAWVPQVKTGVIVVASILGNPGYLYEWERKAKQMGVYLIEDNCESLGAAPHDGSAVCGCFGDLSTFSFFYSHQISGIEGGMILTDNAELAMLCRRLRAHGWRRDDDPPSALAFEHEYDFQHFGYNVRPLEFCAAVAREQLKKLMEHREERRRNWDYFVQRVHQEVLPITLPRKNGFLSPFGLPFTVESKQTRARLATELRMAGIDCRLPTGGSFLKHGYGARWRDLRRDVTPVADRIHDTGMFLGNAPWNIRELIDKAVDVMERVLHVEATTEG